MPINIRFVHTADFVPVVTLAPDEDYQIAPVYCLSKPPPQLFLDDGTGVGIPPAFVPEDDFDISQLARRMAPQIFFKVTVDDPLYTIIRIVTVGKYLYAESVRPLIYAESLEPLIYAESLP